jgi:hypothetical protein
MVWVRLYVDIDSGGGSEGGGSKVKGKGKIKQKSWFGVLRQAGPTKLCVMDSVQLSRIINYIPLCINTQCTLFLCCNNIYRHSLY